MNDPWKSDDSVLPKKRSNKAGEPVAETVEERGSAKGNAGARHRHRVLDRERLNQAVARIRDAAKRDRKQRFTSLLHHVYDVDRLRAAYLAVRRDAAPGVDGMTWEEYGRELEERLQDLSGRLRRMGYRAQPTLRVEIPKANGGTRPLGIPALEDKIVQTALAEVLNAIYEVDFRGFSYGFRPNRSAHRALDALTCGIMSRPVNWVLDADIRGFFDALDHEWMLRFLEHRIADPRVIRLIRKWLRAGVVIDGKRHATEKGTVQGGSISPLLANLYLHHVFDLWADQWRNRHAKGAVVVVRYADDFVVGFEHRDDAERFLAGLVERMQRFGLELHPEKTRLIPFGKRMNRKGRSGSDLDERPGTFDFLGFTHICGKTRAGGFTVFRRTRRKTFQRAIREAKDGLRRRMHLPIHRQGAWLASVVRGHVGYFGVPFNSPAITRFRQVVGRLWRRSLGRRSQKGRITWQRMAPLIARWLPLARICHPYPHERIYGIT
ncbi:MAG: group II intron reverse transcriptase/maturase [Candidatus Eisenbacteria bacterium]|uniref:Group II intron reverse transcriptase/maturase n=1 Tax=Eiseniibacteriota bacterium TaxID=2212470 RepID=A0A956M256_UNCEI|nr:group II intron reverse transcriptase/maturase [Candidatus Eisenbacteria bacterium]